MRNTRQGTSALEGGENVTMKQLMETIHALQQTVATSKTDQDRILAQVQAEQTFSQNWFKIDLDASRTDNEELHRANEELCRKLQRMGGARNRCAKSAHSS